MHKKILAAAVLLGSMTGAMAQSSGEGPWLLRGRAVHLDSVDKDSTGLGLSINNKTLGEFDVTYFMSKNVAAELVLTTPIKQRVYASGTEIGSFKHLPPSLLLQYHFTDLPGYRPYLGAGINYTDITKVSLSTGHTLDSHSWGGALQVGVDIALDRNWSLNLDAKSSTFRPMCTAAASAWASSSWTLFCTAWVWATASEVKLSR